MCSDEAVSRRSLLAGSLSALAVPAGLRGSSDPPAHRLLKVAAAPDLVTVFTEAEMVSLVRNGASWRARDLAVEVTPQSNGSRVSLRSPSSAVLRVHLRWQLETPGGLQYLGDAWERSYGDLSWRGLEPERVLPWYFLAFDGASTVACGVKTGAGALCFWLVDPAGVSLWLDVRTGGRGVMPGERTVEAASIVATFFPESKPFSTARRFCHLLSPAPRLAAQPVYGGNNWYYAYGNSSAGDIRADSERIASLASSSNRPFMVIDDGWSPNPTAGPWSRGNEKFPDMAALAADMQRIGVQPGLWIRPLFTCENVPSGWRLETPNAAREFSTSKGYTLDPSVPEVVENVRTDIRTAVSWGYRLIKHDYSTYDMLGRWGFTMGAVLTDDHWNFADRSRTTAEIIRDFYAALRSAAGDALLLGCNTVGHLAAGLFELQRTGDDTSGRDWNRTRKMGVNTLAFRAAQHNAFFAIDADCVGLTKQISWSFNRQWLDLLARSGTPLFVSAAPDAIGGEQRTALKEAFAEASQPSRLLEPVDWLRNTEPEDWILRGQPAHYRWFGADGGTPF